VAQNKWPLTKRVWPPPAETYDGVDRIVLNAYNSCWTGGLRERVAAADEGSDKFPDNAHLMRGMAGRFSPRVRGFAKTHRIPII